MEFVKNLLTTVGEGAFPGFAEIFGVVVLTLFANLFVGRVLARLQRRLEQTRNHWDDALINAAQRPLAYMIWLLGFSWALEIASGAAGLKWDGLIHPLREVAAVALLCWFAVSLISHVERNVLSMADEDRRADRTTVMAISKLMRTAVIITAVLVAMQSMGLQVSGVLAAGGIGGLAIGFAAKDLLANFFGALMIFLDRPFSVGDWVRSPDRNIEGTVEHIGWRLTRIRTFDKRPLYVPNSIFTQISVENPSRMENRRINETIGIRYDDSRQLDAIVNAVREMLLAHPDIDQGQTLIVNFNSFGASSLDFFIYTFTRTTQWVRYHEIKQDVLLKILGIIHAHGADVAYPTQTLHVQGISA